MNADKKQTKKIRQSKYAIKHANQLRGVFSPNSPLSPYRYKSIYINGIQLSIKTAR